MNVDLSPIRDSKNSLGLDEIITNFSTNAAKPSPSLQQNESFLDENSWQNERSSLKGRNIANPECFMDDPPSLDDFSIEENQVSRTVSPTSPCHLRDTLTESPARLCHLGGSRGEISTSLCQLPRAESPAGLWDDEVANLEKELAEKLDQAEEEKEKLELLKTKKLRRKRYVETLQLQFRSLENLKNVRQDEVDSLQKQVDLIRVETGHFNSERNHSKEEAKQLVARCDRSENEMNRLKKEISNLEIETNLDRELMDSCLIFSEKHESEFDLLKKYCFEDEEKLKNCLFRVDRLAIEEEKSRKDQEEMETLTKNSRLEFHRIRQQIRQGNADRDVQVENWAKIKHQVHNGEKDMQWLQDELDSLSAKTTAKLETLARQKEFHESEFRNNDQLERSLEEIEFNDIKARDCVIDMEKQKQELLDQIQVSETACTSTRRTIKNLKISEKNLSKKIDGVKIETEKLRNFVSILQIKNNEIEKKNFTDEERLLELSHALSEREAQVCVAEKKFKKICENFFKKNEKNSKLKVDLDSVTTNLNCSALYFNNLDAQLQQNRSSAHDQAQQIYEFEFKMTQIQKKISFFDDFEKNSEKLKNSNENDSSQKNFEKLKNLIDRRKNLTDETNTMTQRISRQEESIKNLKKEVDARNVELKKNEISFTEILLYLQTTERSLEKAKIRKIESAIEVSSSRLKLRYITDKADTKIDAVTGMSVRHVELDALFKEQKATVNLEREEYRAQQNRVEEQRSLFVKILRDLEHQQRGVKTRFELLTLPIGEDQGQGDAQNIVQIQAAFFVKAAYEKQNVIKQRTQLKDEIQKVMQDNFRLREFLQKYEAQTIALKNNVFHVKEKSQMEQRQQGLDDEISFLRERLGEHESHIFGYKEEFQILQKTTEKLQLFQDKMQQGKRQEIIELKIFRTELDEQKIRLDRTLKQNSVMLVLIEKKISNENWILIKTQMELSLLADVERLLYSTIRCFLDAYPEAFATLERLFKEMSIEMSEELTKILLRSASGSKSALSSLPNSTKLSSAR